MKDHYVSESYRVIARRFLPVLLLVLLVLGGWQSGHAQITITTPYPAPAQPLTRGLDTSLLTVEVNFLGACTGNVATITLAPGVTYVPGSVVKTAGSAGITIADLGGTANVPTFSISGVTGAGSITFTIKRTAGCGAASSGKDAVAVTGSCGSVTENNVSVNTYSLFSPVLSLTPPAALTNALVGQTATRTVSLTNGGNGCLDTVYYYVVYPAAGIVNTAVGNAITANGVNFVPVSSNGDTLFYKISGAALFGGDHLLCNGESITILENIRVVKCNTTTAYGGGWGHDTHCQMATGTSIMTMAAGVANISAGFNRVQELNWCQKGIFTITYTNNGSAGNANAAYNVVANIGYTDQTSASAPQGSSSVRSNGITKIDSAKVNGVTIPMIPITATQPVKANFTGLTSDPDGAGVGLEDLDGDGEYDDLAPGQSFTVTVYEHWENNSLTCPLQFYFIFTNHTLSYSNMCGTAFTTNALTLMGAYRLNSTNNSITAPPEVEANKPFTLQLCTELGSLARPNHKPWDSLYMEVTLPAGVTLSGSGNITYNGLPLGSNGSYTLLSSGGNTVVRIARKGSDIRYCFALDLVNDCSSGGGNLNIGINNYYQGDTCAASKESYVCTTKVVRAVCSTPCPNGGVSNYVPDATRISLGYTNATMTTKVAPSAVTGQARYTGLPLDTFRIIVPGKENTIAGSFDNLYYDLQWGKANSENVFQFVSGTFNQYRGGSVITSNAIAAPVDGGSTTALQRMHWNLSSNLASGTILDGDSVWLDLVLVVTKANGGQLYGTAINQVPDVSSSMYNLDASSNQMGCGMGHAIAMLLSGTQVLNATLGGATIINCTAQASNSGLYVGNATTYDIFPNEFRPFAVADSILVTLPTGYSLVANRFTSVSWNGLVTLSQTANNTTGIVTQVSPTQWMIKNPYLPSGGWPMADLINTLTANYGIAIDVVATCGAMVGSIQGSITWYHRSYAYAGVASQVNGSSTGFGNYIFNAVNKPAIAVQNNTGTVLGVQPQHYWDVQVNSTATSAAPYIWIALEKAAASGITVDSVVLKPSNVVMTPTGYGTGKNWYQVSTAGLTGGTNQQARVYFKYSNCTNDSILMRAGWNCNGYPSSPDAAACASANQYLKVTPENSQVQIAIDRQPANGGLLNLCTDDSVTVIVNSAQAANVTDPYVVLYPPVGASLGNPVQVEYPLNSGNWQMLTPVSVAGGGFQFNLADHTGIGVNGLPGTAVNPGAAGRQVKVKVPFSASCSFVSGSELNFSVFGSKPCGDNATGNGLSVNTTPVNITGAVTTGDAAVSLSLSGGNTISCGDTKTLSFSVTEVGTVSVLGDSAVYTIPAGLEYVSGSFTGCASCVVTTTPGVAGTTMVKVAIPVGLPSGTVTSFSFDVAPSGIGCGIVSIGGRVERNITGLSCGATPCLSSKLIIGTGTPVAISLSKPTLVINNMAPVGGSLQPGATATVALTINNTGTVNAAANTYIVEFFCGSSTVPFASVTLASAVAAGSSVSANMNINIPAAPACQLGQLVTAGIRGVTDAGQLQCLCSDAMFTMAEALPIRLTQFAGTMNQCRAALQWATAEERNFSRFEVEYSKDGKSFTGVGMVPGKNNVLGSTYSFTYAQPSGKGYYRLKLVDIDHSFAYSKVIMLNADCSDRLPVTFYPNPAKDQVTFTNLQAGYVIRMYDNLGRLVLSEVADQPVQTLKLSGFTSGAYHVVVVAADGILLQAKLIKE